MFDKPIMTVSLQRCIILWLSTVCMLIICIVIVGGITRLTHSGLSMVDWNIITGIIPPLNDADWQQTFNAYQAFPEFQLINSTMTLSEFKWIFFWEYIHRMLGRVIGLAIIIPWIALTISKQLPRWMIQRGLGMALLVITQGLMGWLMVKSGLSSLPDVSHIRLMFHLCFAFTLFIYIWWTLLHIVQPHCTPMNTNHKKGIQLILFGSCVQIIYGAFVAGLKAGYIVNTFPKMDTHIIHPELMVLSPLWINLINNPITVQLIHRIIGVILFVGTLYWTISYHYEYLSQFQRRANYLLMGSMVTQVILGIITLTQRVPITIALAHQLMALITLTAASTCLFGLIHKTNT